MLKTEEDIMETAENRPNCKMYKCPLVKFACLPKELPKFGDNCWTAGYGKRSGTATTESDEFFQVGLNLLTQEHRR